MNALANLNWSALISAKGLFVLSHAFIVPQLNIYLERRLKRHSSTSTRISNLQQGIVWMAAMTSVGVWLFGKKAALTHPSTSDSLLQKLGWASLAASVLFYGYVHLRCHYDSTYRKSLRSQFHGLEAFLPATAEERPWGVGLSLVAGIGEEIIFRCINFSFLHQDLGMGLYSSMVSAAAFFGIQHAYQGWFGALRAGGVGGVFAWILYTTGSLPAVMAAHAYADMSIVTMYQPDVDESPEEMEKLIQGKNFVEKEETKGH